MPLFPSWGNIFCQTPRSTLQRVTPPLLLLLVLLQMPDPGAQAETRDPSRSSKQQQAWWWLPTGARPGTEFSPLVNVTNNDKSESETDQKSSPKTVEETEEEAEEQPGKQSEFDATKATIIRDFVLTHGEAIRRSRRHADLFDGSGYLIDLMDELREFQGRAEDSKQQRGNDRKRRSAPSDKDAADETNIPDFANLSDALAYLNDGKQAEILSGVLNLRFHNEEEDGGGSGEAGGRRRRKRSVGMGDKIGAEEQDGDSPEREAEESMARLDANLQELASYLEEEAAADAAEAREKLRTPAPDATSSKQREAFAKFNHGIGGAYKNLLQLRNMASDLLAESKKPGSSPRRLRHLFPGKLADWSIETEALRDHLRQLERLYRQADEL